MSEIVSEPPPAAVEPKPNPFERIAGVFFWPIEAFASIARRPDWVVPMILLVVVSLASNLIITPRMDIAGMLHEQMDARKDMSAEQKESAIAVATMFQKFSGFLTVFFVPIIIGVVAGVYLIALQMFGGSATFKQMWSATIYAWLPVLVQRILLTILIIPRHNIRPDKVATVVKSNLAAFVPVGNSPPLLVLLSSIDAFYIWSIILLIIGYTAASKLSRGKVITIVLSVWVLAVLVWAGFAGLGSMMQK